MWWKFLGDGCGGGLGEGKDGERGMGGRGLFICMGLWGYGVMCVMEMGDGFVGSHLLGGEYGAGKWIE